MSKMSETTGRLKGLEIENKVLWEKIKICLEGLDDIVRTQTDSGTLKRMAKHTTSKLLKEQKG